MFCNRLLSYLDTITSHTRIAQKYCRYIPIPSSFDSMDHFYPTSLCMYYIPMGAYVYNTYMRTKIILINLLQSCTAEFLSMFFDI